MVDPFSLEAIQVMAILADYHIMDGECLFFFAASAPWYFGVLCWISFYSFLVNLFPNCTIVSTTYLLNSSHFEIYAV